MDYENQIKDAVLKAVKEHGNGDRWHEFVDPTVCNRRNENPKMMDTLQDIRTSLAVTQTDMGYVKKKVDKVDTAINGNGDTGLKQGQTALKVRLNVVWFWLLGVSGAIAELARQHFK